MVVKITNDNFEEEVLKSDKPVLLDFWADWCGPCKMMAPVFHTVADELNGEVDFFSVDVDENPGLDEEAALALKYQIMSIPTLVVMKKGVFEGKSIGVQDKDEVLRLLAL